MEKNILTRVGEMSAYESIRVLPVYNWLSLIGCWYYQNKKIDLIKQVLIF